MKNAVKNAIFKVCAAGGLLAVAATMFLTFRTAFASPDKAVVVFINAYGEANVEAVLMVLVMAAGMGLFLTVLMETFRAVLNSKMMEKAGIDILEV